jgi:glycyl-tRNA synthetase beta chain
MPALLLEIGVEEIPAGMIACGESELVRRIEDLLRRERLAGANLQVTGYSTPRRLAVVVRDVLPAQPDVEEEIVGPAAKIAFKDGAPAPAAIAFAKKNGVEVAALRTVATPKGEYVAVTVTRTGQSAREFLPAALAGEIAAIAWPKNMYWRTGKPERFVRPVRWLVALLDEQVLPVKFGGVTAANVTFGHRVLHGDAPVPIRTPENYVPALRAAFVEPEVATRRQRIRKALDAAAREIPGSHWREDEPLVETVTHLTEWPSVLRGSFDASYLSLPQEVLVTVMRDHQKYFALDDAAGNLAPAFLTVLNTTANASGAAIIRHGNERVLRARFNDARFFWDVDQKIPLTERVARLNSVTFQKELGSYWDKTQAVVEICGRLADVAIAAGNKISSAGIPVIDREALLQAALLAKCDLTTDMVKEFTELQGIVGGLYARAQGLPEKTANAIYSQYMPAAITDPIPTGGEAILLALADRIQTIAAMFRIGLQPSGSKDPFALRRAGNGIAKMMDSTIAAVLRVSDLIAAAIPGSELALREQVLAFLRERVAYYLTDVLAIPRDCVDAAMGSGFDDVADCRARAQAIAAMLGSEDFLAVSAAFKRITNILEQAAQAGETFHSAPAESLFTADAEKHLYRQAMVVSGEMGGLRDHGQSLQKIATLRVPTDAFFDSVMVMDPDRDIRANRLALLEQLRKDFSKIGDFSLIAPRG